MSLMPAPFLLSLDEKFDSMNWHQWKSTIVAAAKSQSILGYLDGTITKPSPPATGPAQAPTTYLGSLALSQEEWTQCDVYAQGLITLNMKNTVGHGVKIDGTAAETWTSLTTTRDAAL
ncbi:hypothetical protein DXG01_010731, partial [Tephrocybe rancida]